MSRTRARLAATGAAVVLAVTALSGTAAADTTATAPTGQAVITTNVAFVQNAALADIVIVPLPPATVGYSTTTGLTTTFPVSGGVANIPAFNGDVQVGGGFLFCDLDTGKSVTFTQLDLVVNKGRFFAVADGSTTPVAILDPTGKVSIGRTGTTQTLNTTALNVDSAAAQYLNAALGTTFFTAGQSVGSLALTYTPGS